MSRWRAFKPRLWTRLLTAISGEVLLSDNGARRLWDVCRDHVSASFSVHAEAAEHIEAATHRACHHEILWRIHKSHESHRRNRGQRRGGQLVAHAGGLGGAKGAEEGIQLRRAALLQNGPQYIDGPPALQLQCARRADLHPTWQKLCHVHDSSSRRLSTGSDWGLIQSDDTRATQSDSLKQRCN